MGIVNSGIHSSRLQQGKHMDCTGYRKPLKCNDCGKPATRIKRGKDNPVNRIERKNMTLTVITYHNKGEKCM